MAIVRYRRPDCARYDCHGIGLAVSGGVSTLIHARFHCLSGYCFAKPCRLKKCPSDISSLFQIYLAGLGRAAPICQATEGFSPHGAWQSPSRPQRGRNPLADFLMHLDHIAFRIKKKHLMPLLGKPRAIIGIGNILSV